MSFNATAIRKRPQAFEALKGQNFVVATIKSAIENNRIAHAYLFSGPRGVGKTTSARLLAKALCCEHGPTAEPCGVCSICKSITDGSAVDVIEIDGASNTSVDDIRSIKEELMFPPQYCRYKIYIIDEVHMLSTSAFNALLKTIEEPPEWAIFIFATTELQKVPLTIQSRCQTFRFRSIDEDTIASLIKKAASDDNIKIDDESVHWISKRARGSARDAYTIFDQCTAFANGDITFTKIKTELGITGADELKAIFESAINEDTTSAIKMLNTLYENGVSAESFTIDFASYLRDVLLIHNGISSETVLYNSSEYYDKGLIDSLSRQCIETALARFLSLYRSIKYSLNAMYEVELEISRLSSLRYTLTNEEIVKRLEYLKTALVNEAKNINPSLLLKISKVNGVTSQTNMTDQASHTSGIQSKPAIQFNTQNDEQGTNNTTQIPSYSPSSQLGNIETPTATTEPPQGLYKEQQVYTLLSSKPSLQRTYKSKKSITFDNNVCTIVISSSFAMLDVQKDENVQLLKKAIQTVYGFNGQIKFELNTEVIKREPTIADNIASFFDGNVI